MITAGSLISPRVVVAHEEERLADLTDRIATTRAHRCVVVEQASGRLLGVVRLADFAGKSRAGQRILADLISPIRPLEIREDEPAAAVAELLEQHAVDDAVVISKTGLFVGLITSESVLSWLRRETLGKQSSSLVDALDLVTSQLARGDLPDDLRQVFRELADALEAVVEPRRVADATVVNLTNPRPSAGTPRIESRPTAGAILLVEDHHPSRAALRALLRRRGYTTLEAATTAEALDIAAHHVISLVLSDIGLPDGTGQTLMAELRTRYGLNGIAMSAYGAPEDIARSKASGFMLHITKPVTGDTLEKVLDSYFAMERAGTRSTR